MFHLVIHHYMQFGQEKKYKDQMMVFVKYKKKLNPLEMLECQIFNSNLLHFTYTSLIQPHILYEYDMDNGRRRKLKERIIPGFIKDQYEQV